MTKKQINNAKKFLTKVVNSKANYRTEEDKLMASYYLTVINENSIEAYVVDIIAMFTTSSKKYIWESIINGKNIYNMVEIRTKDGSTTKNRRCVATVKVGEATRKEAIKLAEAYMITKGMNFTDITFNCI